MNRVSGAQRRNRTTDTGIFSPLLYRLSYLGKYGGEGGIRTHVGLRPNGFRDRPVMTTSIPLQIKYFGVPTGIRTPDTRLRRPLLYPTELWAQNMERKTGFEPATLALARRCSTTEPLSHVKNQLSVFGCQ